MPSMLKPRQFSGIKPVSGAFFDEGSVVAFAAGIVPTIVPGAVGAPPAAAGGAMPAAGFAAPAGVATPVGAAVVVGVVGVIAPLPAAAPIVVGAAVVGLAVVGAAPGFTGNTAVVSVISDPPQAICNTIAESAQADTRAIGSSFVQT
jgi:hypothetical protein